MQSFTKMQALGNDFIVIKGPIEITAQQVLRLCDRHFGIGADGILTAVLTDNILQMQYWNADGTEAEMCGNGLRCVARFAVENNMVKPGYEFTVHTLAGDLKVKWNGSKKDEVEAQIGKVVIEPKALELQNRQFYIADVGNPHAITFVDDVKSVPVGSLGPLIEKDRHFPNRTNVEFIELVDTHNIIVRAWERGVGETLACGTGMAAAANVVVELHKAKFPIAVNVLGGTAKVWVDNEGFTRILGPATNVYMGEADL